MVEMDVIARIDNDYKEKFGIPRQSGLADRVVSRILFEKIYRSPEAVRGLEQFSHLWLLWVFSEAPGSGWSPTVRPPRLGGNGRMGVFATRSPNRPNPIGLSLVELVSVEPDTPCGPVITVRGADLMDGTPILDIKPYIVYADCRPEADSGYASEEPERLTVEGLGLLPDAPDRETVASILAQDPRPRYHDDPERIYGMRYGDWNIRFSVYEKKVPDGTAGVVMIRDVTRVPGS